MAANINVVLLAGNLTRDVTLRQAGERQVADFGLATNRRWTGADGEKHQDTCFVDCEAWGRIGELAHRYLAKGAPCLIEGRLRYDRWVDQQGQHRSRLSVVVANLQFLPRREEGGGRPGEANDRGIARQRDEPRRASEGRQMPVVPLVDREHLYQPEVDGEQAPW